MELTEEAGVGEAEGAGEAGEAGGEKKLNCIGFYPTLTTALIQ